MIHSYAIAVLSYNHPQLTTRCLNSILQLPNQQIAAKNIFLIHNGSNPLVVNELKQTFSEVNHIILEKNRGYSGGANQALKSSLALFPQVLFLTNDTELISLPENPPPGFASVHSFKRKTDKVDSVMGVVNTKNGRLMHLKSWDPILQPEQSYYYIPGTAFWISQSDFSTLGGFDESYHTYWEDVDLSMRAHQLSIPLSYNAATVIRHGIGKTCHKNSFYTFLLFNRNRRKFMKKFGFINWFFSVHFFFDVLTKSRYNFKKLKEVYSE